MPEQESHFTQADRTLITTIHVKLERALDDIKEVKDDFAGRVTHLEENVFYKKEAEDMRSRLQDGEKRLENLEMWRSIQLGALAIITALVIPLIVYIFNSRNNISAEVSQGISRALSNYEVSIK